MLFLFVLLLSATLSGSYTSSSSSATRRDVVKTGITTAGGIILPSFANADSGSPASPTQPLNSPIRIVDGKAVLPDIGTGAWAWGDSLFWGYNPKQDEDLEKVFNLAVSSGNGFFDTAELYGLGRSESLISDFSSRLPPSQASGVSVASKFAPLPWKTSRSDVVKAASASVKRLGRPIDLYQIHFPNAYSNSAYWDGLADCFDKGLILSCGVSNYGGDAVRAVHGALKKRGIPLSSNQVQMSLVYRPALENGLKDTCDELEVRTIAYSPLGLGLLTGKYGPGNYPSGPRAKLADTLFSNPSSEKLFEVMREVGKSHGGASLSQVAINWTVAKGACSIPGARNLRQAESNLNSLKWRINENEVKALDEAAKGIPPLVPPESSPFPKEDKDTGLRMFDS